MFRACLLGLGAIALAIGAVPLLCLATLAAVILATPALAAEVSVPVGQMADFASTYGVEIILGALLWLARKLPASVFAWLQAGRVDQLLAMAIRFGLNSVAGAAKDRKLDVEVGSEVLAHAMSYAIENAPALVRWFGGADVLRDKLIARLDLDDFVDRDAILAGLDRLDR